MKGTVICMPSRLERVTEELSYNGVDFEIFEAITSGKVVDNIADSFKAVIKKNYHNDSTLIFEDDINFTSKYSIRNWDICVSELPDDWDILLGGCYTLSHEQGSGALLKAIDFRSLHCSLFNKKSYDKVMSHANGHIDAYLSDLCSKGQLNVYVCNPMVAIQHPGYSFNRSQNVDYSYMLKNFNVLYD